MPTEIIMPQMGESVVEATVSKWLKAVGDPVDEYEALLEVNTDKVDSEIPSPAKGVLLAALVDEGETVPVGTLLAWVGEPGETIPESEGSPAAAKAPEVAAPAEKTGAAAAPTANVPRPGRNQKLGFISPVVARMASEHQIDLYQVSGTGKNGRITKKDILAYLDKRGENAPTAPSITIPAAPPPGPSSGHEEVLPLTTVRKAIAEHMVMSKRVSPHVTTVMEVDLKRVVAHREANKAQYARDGARLTFTVYFIAATVQALQTYPIVNASWREDGIVLHPAINIGMATSLGEDGLIVPVIKNAEQLSLLGIARAVHDLATRARAKQLKPDEVHGGTFTITNHGISGSLFAAPIINQPQCAILGVGAIQKRVVVINDAIAIRPMAYISLTFDHRILDGAIADHFLGKVVESLRDWQ